MDRPYQAYILHNRVTHIRLQPSSSGHGFNYRTVSLLLSLNALESHSLDLLGGFLFSYGGLYGRLTGLRTNPYLTKNPKRIKQKLIDVLEAEGHDGNELCDAWMMTMPSYLGWEGINPLTVYFCYNLAGDLWLVVLEVHNTFGESHVYVLPLGLSEDKPSARGYDYQWTFPRSFHVSPFNDRSGYYTVSVTRPTHGPSETHGLYDAPTPSVRIHMYTAAHSEDGTIHMLGNPHGRGHLGHLKFAASLTPIVSVPLNSYSLLRTLATYPLVLLFSFLRIVYHAWILHYTKRLDVYMRPEPLGREFLKKTDDSDVITHVAARGVKYQSPSLLEMYACSHVCGFLACRARELGVRILLFPLDQAAAPQIFDHVPLSDRSNNSSMDHASVKTITVRNTSPAFFTHLLLSPSPAYALLRTDRAWTCDNEADFLQLFEVSPAASGSRPLSFRQRLRTYALPVHLLPPVPGAPPIPPVHPLDHRAGVTTLSYLCMKHLLRGLERAVFALIRARFVNGTTPWDSWPHAGIVYSQKRPAPRRTDVT